ncbi:MAG: hypothetical protein ACP5MD_13670 [Verrucomicrobiia bacterium]
MLITEVVFKGEHARPYTSILLRESFRAGSSVKYKTMAVLTHLPADVIEAIRQDMAQPSDHLAGSGRAVGRLLCGGDRLEQSPSRRADYP